MSGLDPAVKKETLYAAAWVLLLSLLMQAVFLIAGKWDLSVLLGLDEGHAFSCGVSTCWRSAARSRGTA